MSDIIKADWVQYDVEKLVGQCAIRKAPVKYAHDVKDYSYTSEAIVITSVSPHGHISYQSDLFNSTLDPRWNDNNWVKAPDFMCNQIFKFKNQMKLFMQN